MSSVVYIIGISGHETNSTIRSVGSGLIGGSGGGGECGGELEGGEWKRQVGAHKIFRKAWEGIVALFHL